MRRLSLVAVLAVLASCGQPGPQNSGVYMLLDTSGTYREELVKAEQIIRYTLSRLGETDTFAVAAASPRSSALVASSSCSSTSRM